MHSTSSKQPTIRTHIRKPAVESSNGTHSIPNKSHPATTQTDQQTNIISCTVKESSRNKSQEDSDFIKRIRSVGCFLCEQTFPSDEAMTNHYFTVHKDKTTSEMDTVSDKPTNPDSGKLAVTRESKCALCQIVFKSPSDVKQHMKAVHSYKCSDCNQIFYSLFESTNHYCESGSNKGFKKTVTGGYTQSSTNGIKNTPIMCRLFNANGSRPVLLVAGNTLKNSGNIQNLALSQDSHQASKYIVPNVIDRPLSRYSNKELKSADLIKRKLEEIKRNPQISLEPLPSQKNFSYQEFLCSRCDILCENQKDFSSHIEECLKLTNVSMVPAKSCEKMSLKVQYYKSNLDDQPYKINPILLKKIDEMKNEDEIFSVVQWGSPDESVESKKFPEVTVKKIKKRRRRTYWNCKDYAIEQGYVLDKAQPEKSSSCTTPSVEEFSSVNCIEESPQAADRSNSSMSAGVQSDPSPEASPKDPFASSENSENEEDPLKIPKDEPVDAFENIEDLIESSYDLLSADDVKMEIEEEIVWDN